MQEIEKENKTKTLINLNLNHCIVNGKCADIVYPVTWLRVQWMCVCYGLGGGETGGSWNFPSVSRTWINCLSHGHITMQGEGKKVYLKKDFQRKQNQEQTKQNKMMCEEKREYSISKCSTLWNEEEEEKKETLTSFAARDGQRTPKKSKSSWEFQSTPQLWNKAFPK